MLISHKLIENLFGNMQSWETLGLGFVFGFSAGWQQDPPDRRGHFAPRDFAEDALDGSLRENLKRHTASHMT